MSIAAMGRFTASILIVSVVVSAENGQRIARGVFDNTAAEPETNMDACAIVRYRGYPCVDYTATTFDGYILGMQRIPHGRNRSTSSGAVVLLQHGFLSDSTNFIANSENQSLGFILADAGHDVWLGNFRGNTYSTGHATSLNSREPEYWDFSWDEMADKDLPAMVDRALEVSEATELYYVGYSLSANTMFAKLSYDLQFARKIRMHIAMAPAVYMGNIEGPVKTMSKLTGIADPLHKPNSQAVGDPPREELLSRRGNFLESSVFSKVVATAGCAGSFLTNRLCAKVLTIAGMSDWQQNVTRVPVYLAHYPAGTSLRTVVHMAQQIKSKTFAKYDYGPAENWARYNSSTPPEYELGNIRTRTIIFAGSADQLGDPTDISLLVSKLAPGVLVANYTLNDYRHLDFIWGVYTADGVYRRIVEHIANDLKNN